MTTRIRITVVAAPRRPFGFGALLDRSRAVADRACQRRRLAEMSDHQLRDIGISRAEAQAASAASWWLAVRGG